MIPEIDSGRYSSLEQILSILVFIWPSRVSIRTLHDEMANFSLNFDARIE